MTLLVARKAGSEPPMVPFLEERILPCFLFENALITNVTNARNQNDFNRNATEKVRNNFLALDLVKPDIFEPSDTMLFWN